MLKIFKRVKLHLATKMFWWKAHRLREQIAWKIFCSESFSQTFGIDAEVLSFCMDPLEHLFSRRPGERILAQFVYNNPSCGVEKVKTLMMILVNCPDYLIPEYILKGTNEL